MSDADQTNPFDGTAVQLVPQNVEKLPLYHWRPGARLLSVGSRDGLRFDGELDASEGNTFRRQLSGPILAAAQQQLATDGVVATWSASLRYPQSINTLWEHAQGVRALASAGYGDQAVWEQLLPAMDACVVAVGDQPGPLTAAMMQAPCHVEVLVGLQTGMSVPRDLPWEAVSAVHLQAQHGRVGPELAELIQAARSQLPESIPIYDPKQQHSPCHSCDAMLVWRHGGRSRVDAWDPQTGRCQNCGAETVMGVA